MADYSSDGKWIAVSYGEGTVDVWSTDEMKLVHTLPHKREMTALAWRPKHNTLVAMNMWDIFIWDTDTGTLMHSSDSQIGQAIRWFANGARFVTVTLPGRVIVRV
jgi:WD40 repeat protein